MSTRVLLLAGLILGNVAGRRTKEEGKEEGEKTGVDDGEFVRELKSLNDVESVDKNTCLCCSRRGEYIGWGYETRDFCMLGYDPKFGQFLGSWSPWAGSRVKKCDEFCSDFPDHKYGKFSQGEHSLTIDEGRKLMEETKADMSYKNHCFDETVRVHAKAGRVSPSADFNSAEFEDQRKDQTSEFSKDRVIAKMHKSNDVGECTTSYVLECPENEDGVHRAAIGAYEECCTGKGCTPPEHEHKKVTPTPNWISTETEWSVCAETSKKQKLITNIDLEDGSSSFAKGAQIIGLREDPDKGCMKATVSSTSALLKQSYDRCPSYLRELMDLGISLDALLSNSISIRALGKNEGTPHLNEQEGMFDRYTTMMYGLMVHVSLKTYNQSNTPASERMGPPVIKRALNKIRSFEVVVADEDVDKYDQTVQGPLLGSTSACAFLVARNMPMRDDIGAGPLSRKVNSWDHLLEQAAKEGRCQSKSKCTKMEYLQTFFDYKNEQGEDLYPTMMFDYAKAFKTGDDYKDGLERHLAFTGIGSHRVKRLASPISKDGETAVYELDMSVYGAEILQLRDPDFSRWGANMLFSAEGLPLMVKLPDGSEVWGSKASPDEWQYAKFAWRSTLINGVTLLDHLWYTHFYVANKAAISVRELLPPAHSLRHLLTLFTWGTPQVNQGAAHQLAGPYGMLHRMTPFRDFGVVSATVQDVMGGMQSFYGPFFSQADMDNVPDLAKSSPFFEDGQDFFNALKEFIDEYFRIYKNDWCSDGHVTDEHIVEFLRFSMGPNAVIRDARWRENLKWLGMGADPEHKTARCEGLKKLVTAIAFGVTGFHRHVGTVADLMKDPELTSPSWAIGARAAQPRQAMQATLIAATTGFANPKLAKNDWTFMFKKLRSHKEPVIEAVKTWQGKLQNLVKTVDQRNADRIAKGQVPYYHMHPLHVENSVAV